MSWIIQSKVDLTLYFTGTLLKSGNGIFNPDIAKARIYTIKKDAQDLQRVIETETQLIEV